MAKHRSTKRQKPVPQRTSFQKNLAELKRVTKWSDPAAAKHLHVDRSHLSRIRCNRINSSAQLFNRLASLLARQIVKHKATRST